ncbi:hypothetical protein AB0M29_31705 [Streptomyces sp. NPDC051976]|uniref:hypothetical protein n=1 Tax=Streptomyces sp. NPDC051976 TaxID=3154947 RepID=UPI003447768E
MHTATHTTRTTSEEIETTGRAATERVHVDHAVTKRFGHWTRADLVEVRARSGCVVLDLRSPEIPDDVEIRLDLRHALLKVLVADDTAVDHWDLRWTAKGRVKDGQGAGEEPGKRRVRLVGTATDSEIRVHRGGIAILSAMFSREYLRDLRRAHAEGGHPTVDDPARDAAPEPAPASSAR